MFSMLKVISCNIILINNNNNIIIHTLLSPPFEGCEMKNATVNIYEKEQVNVVALT